MLAWNQIEKEVRFTAVRSRGPGGQNVNKVASAALLSWAYADCAALSLEQKELLRHRLSRLINKDQILLIRSDEFRDLGRNKQRCLEKLEAFIKAALHKPKTRKATRPTRASKRKARETKSRRSDIKKDRRKPDY